MTYYRYCTGTILETGAIFVIGVVFMTGTVLVTGKSTTTRLDAGAPLIGRPGLSLEFRARCGGVQGSLGRVLAHLVTGAPVGARQWYFLPASSAR